MNMYLKQKAFCAMNIEHKSLLRAFTSDPIIL